MGKLISLCFPIYNRISTFRYTFSRTIEEVCKTSSDEIEVVVSVNPEESTIDETKLFLSEIQNKTEIIVNINPINIGIAGNGRRVFELASGKYIWMIGDDDFILPGCLEQVLKVVHEHPDIGWIYLAYARLNGYPENSKSKISEISSYVFRNLNGYLSNGKETIMKAHNVFGGRLLFSSVNIFLKSAWSEVAEDNKNDNPQLGAMFCSAAKGGCFLDPTVRVVAGGEVSWTGQSEYSNEINFFRDMYFSVGHGINKSEVDSLFRFYMQHEGLHLWFYVYKSILIGNRSVGKQALGLYFKTMPFQTILHTTFLPVDCFYLFVRHHFRNIKRRLCCTEYKKSYCADPYVASRI